MSRVEHQDRKRPGLEKLCVPLPANAWHGYENEWLWAEPVSEGIYALRNVPFYAKGLSYEDLVRAEEQGGALVVTGVARHGGHSTYRIIAKDGRSAPKVKTVLDRLIHLGCELEPATERLVAIDVPPQVDVYDVYDVLSEAEAKGILDFDEGHCGHPLRDAGSNVPKT